MSETPENCTIIKKQYYNHRFDNRTYKKHICKTKILRQISRVLSFSFKDYDY
jgi:hypothetical protein